MYPFSFRALSQQKDQWLKEAYQAHFKIEPYIPKERKLLFKRDKAMVGLVLTLRGHLGFVIKQEARHGQEAAAQ